MNIGKQFILLISALALIILTGHIIPSTLKIKAPNLKNDIPENYFSQRDSIKKAQIMYNESLANPIIPDPTVIDTPIILEKVRTLKEVLMDTITVINTRNVSQNDFETWYVARGTALPWQLLITKNVLEANDCDLTYARELNTTFPRVSFGYKCPNDIDTTEIVLRTSKTYKDSASVISIIFEVTKFDASNLAALKELEKGGLPFALSINPFTKLKDTFNDLDKLNKPEVIISLKMEPTYYPSPKPNILQIDHNEREIQTILNSSFKQLPQAIGLISRDGDRALTNKPLVNTLIKILKRQNMFFIDKSLSKRSKTYDVCQDHDLDCEVISYLNKGDIPHYLNSRLRLAKRMGHSIILLPLNRKNIEEFVKILPKCKAQGTKVEKLSTLFFNRI